MADTDLTVEILREIRDEIRGTNVRLDSTNSRLEATRTELKSEIAGTNARLDETNERLGSVEDTLKELAGQQVLLTRYVKNSSDRQEHGIDDLRERVTRIETKLGT